jgi:hypothetical protein
MTKHVIAINVLNDELERIVKDIQYLQICLGKSKLNLAIYPHRQGILLSADLRWRRIMKQKIKEAKAIEAAIKSLERDI